MIVSSPGIYKVLKNYAAETGANDIWVFYLKFFFVH
jgi:hypothetical protein